MNSFCTHVRGPHGCVWCDAGHAALGFTTALLPGPWRALSALGFFAYQMARAKPAHERVRSLNQWGLGYFGGSLL